MVKIGIVDDEQEARARLREALDQFAAEYHRQFEVLEFDSAAAYLSAEAGPCDILYLDIDMPQMSGMELAEKIRETDTELILIFCTNLEQFAVNGYSVSALGFMVKPVQWYSFHMYLDRALKVHDRRAQLAENTQLNRIAVKDGPVSRFIDTADIKYVEVRQHYLLYHIAEDKADAPDTVIRTRGSMQEAAGQLSPWGFARCGASFLVNLSRVTAVNRMEVYIGSVVLPIGRTYKDSFTKEFSRFLARRGWGDL